MAVREAPLDICEDEGVAFAYSPDDAQSIPGRVAVIYLYVPPSVTGVAAGSWGRVKDRRSALKATVDGPAAGAWSPP